MFFNKVIIKNKSEKVYMENLYLNININIKMNTIKFTKFIDYFFIINYNVNVHKEKT